MNCITSFLWHFFILFSLKYERKIIPSYNETLRACFTVVKSKFFYLRVFLRVFLMQLVTLDFCIYPEIKKIWRNRNSRYSWLVTTRISKAKYLRHSPLKWWRYFYYDGDCRIENCIWLQKSIFFKFCIFLWNSVKKRAYGIMNPYTLEIHF